MSKLIRISACLYQQAGTKKFFHSVKLPGKPFPTKRKLTATTKRAAIAEIETINTRRREAKLGVALDPYTELVTIGDLATAWLATHCQDRDGKSRMGQSLETETARVNRLLPFWKHKSAREVIAYEDCPEYHTWRIKQKTRNSEPGTRNFRLGRSVDAELTTLSNLLQWAAMNPRKTGMKFNPLATRPRFDNPKLIRHCTAVMPMCDEDFHRLATYLFASDQSRPLGWQLLLEGLTGCRTSEILKCRLDAKLPEQAGFLDHHALHIHRLKDGIKPWALLEAAKSHAPLRDCLQAFLNWHEQRYPVAKYPADRWFIPGHSSAQPVRRTSLTRALHRACAKLGIPLVTSHGLRAYHVAALRSMGQSDEEIADRLGHRSTVQVEQTYGTVKPGFRGSWQLDLLPEDTAPAWETWKPKHPYAKLLPPETNNKKTISGQSENSEALQKP